MVVCVTNQFLTGSTEVICVIAFFLKAIFVFCFLPKQLRFKTHKPEDEIYNIWKSVIDEKKRVKRTWCSVQQWGPSQRRWGCLHRRASSAHCCLTGVRSEQSTVRGQCALLCWMDEMHWNWLKFPSNTQRITRRRRNHFRKFNVPRR